jgi:hypothetical protein
MGCSRIGIRSFRLARDYGVFFKMLNKAPLSGISRAHKLSPSSQACRYMSMFIKDSQPSYCWYRYYSRNTLDHHHGGT